MMRTVADALREDDRRRIAAMTAEERIQLALRLGDEAVRAYADTHGVSDSEARRILTRARRTGRIPSRCIEELGK